MRPEADGCATRESEAYASAIYWADDDGAWCKLGATQWQCLVPGTGGLRAAATYPVEMLFRHTRRRRRRDKQDGTPTDPPAPPTTPSSDGPPP